MLRVKRNSRGTNADEILSFGRAVCSLAEGLVKDPEFECFMYWSLQESKMSFSQGKKQGILILNLGQFSYPKIPSVFCFRITMLVDIYFLDVSFICRERLHKTRDVCIINRFPTTEVYCTCLKFLCEDILDMISMH